jgi:mannose-1-phosphate guanylyltransferase
VDLEFIEETEPLGTGGAVGNAGRLLRAPAVVTNGDVLTDLDIGAALRFHREKGGLGTLVLHPVADARRYGVVLTDASGRIMQFIEKPEHPPSNLINAGFYILEPEFFELIPAGPSSIERDIFPKILAAGGPLYAYVHRGYWLDIGTLESYRRATRDLIDGALPAFHAEAVRDRIQSPLPGGATADAFSVIGPRCAIESGARIEGSVIFEGSALGPRCRIVNSILGFGSRVAPDAMVEGAVLIPSTPDGMEGTERS